MMEGDGLENSGEQTDRLSVQFSRSKSWVVTKEL